MLVASFSSERIVTVETSLWVPFPFKGPQSSQVFLIADGEIRISMRIIGHLVQNGSKSPVAVTQREERERGETEVQRERST